MKTDLSESQELVRPVAEKITPSEMEVLVPNPPPQNIFGHQNPLGGHSSSSGAMEYHSIPPPQNPMSHELNESLIRSHLPVTKETSSQPVPYQPGPGSSRHSLAGSISGPTSPVTVQSTNCPVQPVSPYEQDDEKFDENTELPDSFHPKPTGFTIPPTSSDPQFDVSFEGVTNSVGPGVATVSQIGCFSFEGFCVP